MAHFLQKSKLIATIMSAHPRDDGASIGGYVADPRPHHSHGMQGDFSSPRYHASVRFELVRERVDALPRELPDAPAILTPIRLDTGEADVAAAEPSAPASRSGPIGGPGPDAAGEAHTDSRHRGSHPSSARRRGKPAAVLVLLFPDSEGQARVLLTVRVPHLSTHAGEVSFPGGSAEPADADPIETALREASEEVGLDPAQCGLRVTGALETFALTVSGFRITPVVALAETRPDCRPNPEEVGRIIEAPVEAFLPDAPVELEERVIRERLIRYGVYPVEGERVWGATARMLGQLGAALATVDTGRAHIPASIQAGAVPNIRIAGPADEPAIGRFLDELAPELARRLPPATELVLAEMAGGIVGLASWAPWDRPRDGADPRGFEGLTVPQDDCPAELTLLAVAPHLRGRGIGRGLTDAVAAAARQGNCTRLLAWTLADSACHPSSLAARAFFRTSGFEDLAVDRALQARGEDRLLLSRPLG
jgi:8-oxo-dGTP pyrophosphatase MutT (NUDIX family)/GNAT superfamily N-acetyltransferase